MYIIIHMYNNKPFFMFKKRKKCMINYVYVFIYYKISKLKQLLLLIIPKYYTYV